MVPLNYLDIVETEELLVKSAEEFAGKDLPLHNLCVTNLCWARLLFAGVAPLVPKRLKKNASATAKEAVRCLFLFLAYLTCVHSIKR